MSALVGIKAIATTLDVSKATAYRMAVAGEIPGVKVRGRWKFDETAVLEHVMKPKDVWAQPKHSGVKKRAS
jgi:excisionase family DNA binding protein